MIHRTRCCARRDHRLQSSVQNVGGPECNASWCNAYDRLAWVARREQRRGWSSDAYFFDGFHGKKLGQERVRSNDQEQSAAGSMERIRQAVEKRDVVHEETHREAPDDWWVIQGLSTDTTSRSVRGRLSSQRQRTVAGLSVCYPWFLSTRFLLTRFLWFVHSQLVAMEVAHGVRFNTLDGAPEGIHSIASRQTHDKPEEPTTLWKVLNELWDCLRWPQIYTQCTWSREAVTTAGLMRWKEKAPGTRQHGEAAQQELTTCEKSASKPLGTRPHQVSPQSVRTLQEAHITRGDRWSKNMWDSIDSLCHDASTTESTRSFSQVGATLAVVRTNGHTSKSRWKPASNTGEHNFELEFRKVYAARERICRVVGAERPGVGPANDVKTDSLNHAIDSDESRRRVKTVEIHSDTTHGRSGTVRVQPRTPDSKKKERSSENKQVPGSPAQYLHSSSSMGGLQNGEQRRSESSSTKDDNVEESLLPVGNSAKKLRINAPGLQDDVRDAVSPSSSVLHQELKQSVDAAQRELGNSTTRSEWTQRGPRGIFTSTEWLLQRLNGMHWSETSQWMAWERWSICLWHGMSKV